MPKKLAAFILFFIIALLIFRFFNHKKSSPLSSINKWFILLDYDFEESFDFEKARQFDMAIFDPHHHPPLDVLKDDLLLIGYVSVGEAEDYRSYWKTIVRKPWIIKRNPNWKGNYYVDVRNPEWQDLILDQVIPEIVAQGFQGLMLDTLDTSEILEEDFDGKFEGAHEAMIQLVQKIHQRYPDLYLVSNNGFSILLEIAPYLSGILVEDIHSMIDFKQNGYRVVPQQEQRYKIEVLQEITNKHNLPIFNIDYVAQNQRHLIEKYLQQSRQLGYRPYIAEKDLSKIYQN